MGTFRTLSDSATTSDAPSGAGAFQAHARIVKSTPEPRRACHASVRLGGVQDFAHDRIRERDGVRSTLYRPIVHGWESQTDQAESKEYPATACIPRDQSR